MDIPIDTAFHTAHVPGTPIEWYLSRMKASGITEDIATKCGLKLSIDEQGAYFNIPYFNVDGVATTHRRQRNRDEVRVQEGDVSAGNFKGKYTQKKGSKNHVYWPPIYPQRLQFNSPEYPLLVCEGELKSVAAQKAVFGNGTPMLIAGVPGTKLCQTVREELLAINCIGTGNQRRVVYLCTDWNGKGQARERAADLEYDLKKLFQGLGARVVVLRWVPIEGTEKEEQKLDDWIVAGGDLGKALKDSEDEVAKVDTELAALWDYFNSNYCIMHGFYIPLSNTKQKYTVTAFRVMEPSKRLQISAKKFLHPDDVWALQPPDQRNVVDGYIFKPAPLGQEVERYVWEEGKRMLNTAPQGTWESVPFATEEPPDAAPFVALVTRLCQDGAGWMLDFLAHAAQRPTERGPHIIILRDEGGTGKSRLFETLDEVFGRYSGPIGDSLSSSFNAELEHLVMAWWSDPVIHGGFDRDLESALKNFSGDSKISINHKGGAKYTVKNYGRLLIATNKDWIVPINSKERRYSVFGGTEPMSHSEALEYMAWLREGGRDAIRQFLVDRDLSQFSIHAPGPRTAQREEMEKLSAPPLLRFLGDDYFESKDIWTVDEIRQRYADQTGRRVPNETIGRELTKGGILIKPVRDGKVIIKLRCLRNFAKWEAATPQEWLTEQRPKHA